MKIRSGFVSNSSTSSFVILGFLLTQKEEEALNEEGCGQRIEELQDKDMCHYLDEGTFIGVKIARSHDDMLDWTKTPLIRLNEQAKEIAEQFGKDTSEIMLITGIAGG